MMRSRFRSFDSDRREQTFRGAMIGLILISLYALQFGVQARQLVFEAFTINKADERYFDRAKTRLVSRVTEDGRDVIDSSIVFVNQLPANTTAYLEILGLSMGLFQLDLALRFTRDFCDLIDDPVFFGPMFTAFGFARDPCPPLPGTYEQKGFEFPRDNLPEGEGIPENDYRGFFKIFVGDEVVLDMYADVTFLYHDE